MKGDVTFGERDGVKSVDQSGDSKGDEVADGTTDP